MLSDAREAVLREATTWLGTPFHHEARVKGAGVDCGQLLIAVYSALGYMPADYRIPHYSHDFAQHRDEEWYLKIVASFAREIEGPPRSADIVLFHWGRLYSHGAIVVKWPHEIIHAWGRTRNVCRFDATKNPLANKARKFFSPFDD